MSSVAVGSAAVESAAAGPVKVGSAANAYPSTVGRTRITSRALNNLVAAVAAEALGVDARSVNVDIADQSGSLAVTVRSPLRVVSLKRVQDDPSLVSRTGGSLLQRASVAQQQIRERTTELSGSNIARVTVRLTGVVIRQERRVK